MKKRTFKKLVTTMAMLLLFSSTIVYGSTVSFSFTLNPTQIGYTSFVSKNTSYDYARVTQQCSDAVIQYTVLGTSNTVKTPTATITASSSKTLFYNENVAKGVSLRLKAYNYPADNMGAVRYPYGYWVP